MNNQAITRIKQTLAHANETQLAEIIRWAKDRKSHLQREAYAKKQEAKWEEMKGWGHNGDIKVQFVWAHTAGLHFGSPIQRGDKLEVVWIQPRKRMLWAKKDGKGKEFGFTVKGAIRYDLRPEPCEDKLSEWERKMSDKMGERLSRALNS